MGLTLIIIGIIFIVASLGYDIFKIYTMCRTHTKENLVQNQKMDFTQILICGGVFALGWLLLYIGLLFKNEVPFTAGYMSLIVIGTLLFNFFFMEFLNLFILKHFKHDLTLKSMQFLKIFIVISVFGFIIFFLVMMEGLAPYLTYPFPNSIIFGGDNGISLGYPQDKKSGGVSIAFYAICILSGAIFVYLLCDHRLYKIYGKHGLLESTFLLAFPSGIIGARLWYCYVLEWETYSKWDGSWGSNVHNNPFQIWDGGLAIMGGALLGIIVGVLWVIFKKKEINIRTAVDIIVPTILIAQAVGRWGNFFNQEVYSSIKISYESGWWIPTFIKNSMVSIDYHPYIPYKDGLAIAEFNLPLFYIEGITNIIGYYFIRYLFEARYLFIGIGNSYKKIALNSKKLKNLDENEYRVKLEKIEQNKETISHLFPRGGCAGMYLIWYGFTRVILEPLRESEYEYSESLTSAWILVGLGALVIILFAIYQYVIEPRIHKPMLISEENQSSDQSVEVRENSTHEYENASKEVNKEQEKKSNKKKKSSSLNDEI